MAAATTINSHPHACQHSTNTWPGYRACPSVKYTSVTLATTQWQQHLRLHVKPRRLILRLGAAPHNQPAQQQTRHQHTRFEWASTQLVGCEQHMAPRETSTAPKGLLKYRVQTLPARQHAPPQSLSVTLCEASCAHSTPTHSTNFQQRIPPPE